MTIPFAFVVMAVPKDVLRGSTHSMTLWVITFVGVDQFRRMQPVWGSYAACHYRVEGTSVLVVVPVVRLEVVYLFGRGVEVGSGGGDINKSADADHIFTIIFGLDVIAAKLPHIRGTLLEVGGDVVPNSIFQ